MKTIHLYVESDKGHDTLNVPQTQLQNAVEGQLKDDKWVTIEKKDGNTEILTAKDMPKEEKPKEVKQSDSNPKTESKGKDDDWKNSFSADKVTETPSIKPSSSVPNKDWAKKFEKIKSATSTNKAKGG